MQRPILPIHYVIRVCALLPILVRALIRIWAKQGYPAIPIWAARTRMGQEILPIRVWDSSYAYGQNTRMGRNNSNVPIASSY